MLLLLFVVVGGVFCLLRVVVFLFSFFPDVCGLVFRAVCGVLLLFVFVSV